MRYKYTFRLTENEAKQLGIILKEPVEGRYPKSTDWEFIQSNKNGELIICPAIFLNTKKYQWEMKPNFEWTLTILLPEPLHTKHMFFDIKAINPLPTIFGSGDRMCIRRHTNALPFAEEYLTTKGHLYWHPETADIRSDL